MVQFSPTGQPLNLHAQMAHAPAVREAYVSIRRATARHGALEGPICSALMLTGARRTRPAPLSQACAQSPALAAAVTSRERGKGGCNG